MTSIEERAENLLFFGSAPSAFFSFFGNDDELETRAREVFMHF
jgi:hypothetical protein